MFFQVRALGGRIRQHFGRNPLRDELSDLLPSGSPAELPPQAYPALKWNMLERRQNGAKLAVVATVFPRWVHAKWRAQGSEVAHRRAATSCFGISSPAEAGPTPVLERLPGAGAFVWRSLRRRASAPGARPHFGEHIVRPTADSAQELELFLLGSESGAPVADTLGAASWVPRHHWPSAALGLLNSRQRCHRAPEADGAPSAVAGCSGSPAAAWRNDDRGVPARGRRKPHFAAKCSHRPTLLAMPRPLTAAPPRWRRTHKWCSASCPRTRSENKFCA